jgi:transcription antitermination factor NusG
LLATTVLLAQTEAPKPSGRVLGEVTAKDPSGKQLTVKADSGASYTVTVTDETRFLKVAPGEKDLKNAAKISAGDVGVGDRVIARGQVSEEQKTASATSVIVMSKTDLAQKQQHEREEWQQRGSVGLVKEVHPEANEITIESRSRDGVNQMMVMTTPQTQFHRYAPDSVRFADAKPSSLAEIKPGDQLRVLGNKNPEKTTITAESIVSGSFRTIGGTVISIDPATGEIKLNDLETKKPISIKTNSDTQFKKLPPQAAMFLAMQLNPDAAATIRARAAENAGNGGADRGAATDAGQGAFQRRTPGAGQGGPAGAGGDRPRFGGAGRGDIQQMLERMPSFTLAELKPGDPLIISSTVGADQSTVHAITVLSGVEPILTAAPRGQLNLGTWSLDMQMPQ